MCKRSPGARRASAGWPCATTCHTGGTTLGRRLSMLYLHAAACPGALDRQAGRCRPCSSSCLQRARENDTESGAVTPLAWRSTSTSHVDHVDARSFLDSPAMQLTRVVSCKPWEPAVGPLAHLQQPLLHGCAVATLLFFFTSQGRMFSTTAWNQITAAALRHSSQSRACRNAIRGATACPVLENIRPGCQSFTLPTILATPCIPTNEDGAFPT